MKQVVLVGYFQEYDKIANPIRNECAKSNMNIVGLYIPNMKEISYFDGFSVLSDEEFLQCDFDYIIVFSEEILEFVTHVCEMRKRSRECVLSGRIFDIAGFNFKKYIELYESKISIMCNTCFGGLLCYRLGMEFLSPFINLFLSSSDFLKIMMNIKQYMSQPLVFWKYGFEPNLKREYPIMSLGDTTLHFNHYKTIEEAEESWTRRLKRINYDNIFVECVLENETDAKKFADLPYQKKLGFANFEFEHPQVIDKTFLNKRYFDRYSTVAELVNNQAQLLNEVCLFDVLALLNGEEEFMRIR